MWLSKTKMIFLFCRDRLWIEFLVIALLITSMVFLLSPGLSSAETVARIRDVFIIFMAFESLLIGGVLVILIVQLARLTNLLQNEIKRLPVVDENNRLLGLLGRATLLQGLLALSG